MRDILPTITLHLFKSKYEDPKRLAFGAFLQIALQNRYEILLYIFEARFDL
jgi:hypothetical protein